MHDQAFPKAKRLLKNAEYQKVYAQGSRKTVGSITLHWLEVDRNQCTRVGLAVGRKIGNAVTRNRIKRRLRHLVRTCPQPLDPGYWVILAATEATCATENMNILENNLYHAFNGIFK